MAVLRLVLLFFPCFLMPLLYGDSSVFIIVPGTWAHHTTGTAWHQPGGDFFEALSYSARKKQATVLTFTWSGKNNHHERLYGAQQLAKIMASYDHINLVTHSHGSNVGILACSILGAQGCRSIVHQFFALATPVAISDYMPDMNVIDSFYNFFSFADVIQPVLGSFGRVFPTHERIANINVTIEGKEPTHTNMHHHLIATWLPFIPQSLVCKQPFTMCSPGTIHFSTKKPPYYETDKERNDFLELDRAFQQNLAVAFGRIIVEKNVEKNHE